MTHSRKKNVAEPFNSESPILRTVLLYWLYWIWEGGGEGQWGQAEFLHLTSAGCNGE